MGRLGVTRIVFTMIQNGLGLSNVAEELGVTVRLKHKKINVSNSRVAWEHEQFSRLRVTAATLSGLSGPPDLVECTGEFVNEAAVVKSVKVVAESLADSYVVTSVCYLGRNKVNITNHSESLAHCWDVTVPKGPEQSMIVGSYQDLVVLDDGLHPETHHNAHKQALKGCYHYRSC
ncbi:nicalin-1 [Tanacetum coccineum]